MFLTAFFLSCKYSANAEMPSWQAAVKMSERLQENGKLHEAEQVLLEILRKDPGIEPAGLAYLYNNLGSVCQDERRYVVARRHYQRSIAEWEKAGDAHRMALARTLNNLGSLHWDTGKIAEAERTLMRSASLQIEAVGRDRPEAAPLFYNLGALYLRQKRWEEAASAYRQFVVIEDRRAVEGLETAVATNNLGILYRRMGRQAEADRLFARARSIWERSRGERDAQKLLLDLAKSFWSGNQRTEAALAARQAMEAAESRFGPGDPRTAQTLRLYAAILRRTNRKTEARDLEKRAKDIGAGDTQEQISRSTVHVSDLIRR